MVAAGLVRRNISRPGERTGRCNERIAPALRLLRRQASSLYDRALIDTVPRSIAPLDAPSIRDGAVANVRAVLREADYSTAGISAIGVDPGLGVRRGDVPVLLQALKPVEPLATLVRLFLLGQDVLSGELERRLGDAAAAFSEAGLLKARGGRVAAAVALTPWRGRIVAHDPDPPGDLWPGHVTGPNPAAETLTQLMISTPVQRALDVGTGSGVLALAESTFAGRVIATDVNATALGYAALTAALSGAENIETREGSLFEPVPQERFGLVVSNPPFVISPETDLLFRHSPMSRDELSGTVVRDAAHHLEEGGYAIVLANWIQEPDAPWADVPVSWTRDIGCDTLLLLHGIEDPLAYAVRWNLRLQQLAPDRYPATLASWLEYYRREKIESLASGVVILRRRPGPNWLHGLEVTGDTRGTASAHLLAIVAAQDYLARSPSDDDLLSTALAIPAAHRLDQSLRSQGSEYVVDATSLSLAEGLGIDATIEPDLVPILLRLDGSQLLAEAVRDVAALTGADPDGLADRAVAFVLDLLRRGFAAPAV
jgi:methylase of polypeptide subunit release factors